jgi:mRNA-degrading endonuclease RelE of RelBE toxin-antitoxin system
MHRTTDRFWQRYWGLPKDVQALADKNFQLLKDNPRHTSLQLKKVGGFWSARVGLAHRALAVGDGSDLIRVWIGSHDEYERIVKNR